MTRTARLARAALTTGTAAMVLAVAGPAAAHAVPPANQACLGRDASAAARALADAGSSLGQVISVTATSAPGAIGEEVQLHLSGQIPDEVFPNSCND